MFVGSLLRGFFGTPVVINGGIKEPKESHVGRSRCTHFRTETQTNINNHHESTVINHSRHRDHEWLIIISHSDNTLEVHVENIRLRSTTTVASCSVFHQELSTNMSNTRHYSNHLWLINILRVTNQPCETMNVKPR